MSRRRLDLEIEARGLLPSRARARDAILRGTVSVNGIAARKPNQPILPEDAIALDDPAASYVSRAALKLIAGLDAGAISPAGLVCLDVGSSTGGFSQVLLERHAARVYAVDVGHDQMHERLRADPRLVLLEGFNARDLGRNEVPEPIDVVTCDVSFTSIAKVLGAPLALARPGAQAVVLFKPQFEVGRDHVGKGGIVTDDTRSAEALAETLAYLGREGWTLRRSLPSPITGGDGNRETVLVLEKKD